MSKSKTSRVMKIDLNNIIIILGILGLSILTKFSFGQDPEFTQFYSSPLYLNPAFAGAKVCPRISLNHRNQWANLTGNFVTTSASYDQMFSGISGGLGFMAMTDMAANTLRTTRVSGIYSFNQAITRKFSLNFAGEVTFFQKSIDWTKLTFGDMIDNRRGFVYESREVQPQNSVANIDFSAGIIGYTDIFFFGIAAHHLTEPNESFVKGGEFAPLPTKMTIHGGANIPVGSERGGKYQETNASISPNILFRTQNGLSQLMVGLYAKKGPITAGLWYRNRDAFVTSVGIETAQLKIGYSYDLTVSKLSIATGGSHEISLGVNLNCKPKKRKYRTISCPSF